MGMKYLKSYTQINEAKQVGLLYHVTSMEGFHNIVKDNFKFKSQINSGIRGKENKASISFSRKPKGDFMPTLGRMVRFTIDGDKLSHKYKIQPYADRKSLSGNYGRREYASQYDEAESILIRQKDGNYGKPVDLKPYIIRIDVIYHSMFDRDFERERDFLESIDLPVFVHKDTWDSTHEVPVIQKHKSKFKEPKDIIKRDILLPEAQALFELLNESLDEDRTNEDSEYIDGMYNTQILHSGSIQHAKRFKSIEDMANQLSKYPDTLIKGVGRVITGVGRVKSKYYAKYLAGQYVAYKAVA